MHHYMKSYSADRHVSGGSHCAHNNMVIIATIPLCKIDCFQTVFFETVADLRLSQLQVPFLSPLEIFGLLIDLTYKSVFPLIE